MTLAEIVPVVGIVIGVLTFWRTFRKDVRAERGLSLEQEVADERLRQEFIAEIRAGYKERNDELRKDLERQSVYLERQGIALEAERERSRRYLRRIEQLEQKLHASGISVPPAPPVP